MKQSVEIRKPSGLIDNFSLAVTTFGVGYLPLAPGTWGSAVGVALYVAAERFNTILAQLAFTPSFSIALFAVLLTGFTLIGIAASERSIPLLGNVDPSEAVVDEVIGQLITFLFVPFAIGWPLIVAGFLLFRLFDIWKPYPIDGLQNLPGGLGICGDDIVAGVYAGVCLAVLHALTFLL